MTLRDRIYTRRTANAMMSPAAILATGGGAAAGILVGLPVAAAVGLGALGWGAVVSTAIARAPGAQRTEKIDPFTLQDPWRAHVVSALTSKAQVNSHVDDAPGGPLREALQHIAARVDQAVDQSWQVAKRGHALASARAAIRSHNVDRQIRELEQSLAENPDSPQTRAALDARKAQQATAERMDRVIAETDAQLRLLDARLDEIVVRAVELASPISTDTSLAGSISGAVDSVITDMEALRQALDETNAPGYVTAGEPQGKALDGGGTANATEEGM